MGDRTYEVTLTRVYDAPRSLVWALVADTDRWDRASGLTPGRYEWREVHGRRQRGAIAKEMGFTIEWIEPPYEWVEGSFVYGAREFLRGPVERGGFTARLREAEGGTEVEATAFVGGSGGLMPVIGRIMKSRFRRALTRYLDGIAEVLSRADDDVESSSPAVMRVRRALMAGYDTVMSGPRSPSVESVLVQRAGRLREQGVADELADRLVELLRDRPDEEVAQIRPFELASIWGIDRRQALSAFLHATVAGLVDLRWQINCPVCRVSAGVVSTLEEVRGDVHCQACNIAYDVDFGNHVEAVFQANPAVRVVETAVYCASSPSFLPHVYAQISVDRKETREEAAELPPGPMHVRLLQTPHAADVEIDDPHSVLEVTVHVDGVDVRVLPAAGGERGLVRAINRTARPAVVMMERSGWAADAVLGSVVASLPEFLDLFATEAPASGVDLSIGHLALLFSDLTGSTALYERVGDARAFAIVEEHFRIMEGIVQRHEGAVIKTMGDAVMASFASPASAVQAALEMVGANDVAHGELGLGVKLGVHAGPCLAVRANERLDFFGTTVNVAARLQAQAEGGHLVLTEGLATDAQVAPLIGDLPQSPFQTELKGIHEEQRLISVDAREYERKRQSKAS